MADVAQGTVLKWGGTAITEITGFNGPSLAHEAVDLTDLDDTAKNFKPAMVYDGGEVSIDFNFDEDDTTHAQLKTDLMAGQERVLLIEWQNTGTAATTTWTANAFVTGLTPTGAVADKLSASATFKIDGAVTG